MCQFAGTAFFETNNVRFKVLSFIHSLDIVFLRKVVVLALAFIALVNGQTFSYVLRLNDIESEKENFRLQLII